MHASSDLLMGLSNTDGKKHVTHCGGAVLSFSFWLVSNAACMYDIPSEVRYRIQLGVADCVACVSSPVSGGLFGIVASGKTGAVQIMSSLLVSMLRR